MITRDAYTAIVERCLRLEAGVPVPAVSVPLIRRRITPALEAQIRALWAAGVARKDIAAQLGVAYSAVWSRTRKD